MIQGGLYNNCQEPYNKLTQIFSEILDYHAPVKQKVVRGNQSPFVTKDLSKAKWWIKSKPKNQYVKWPSRENYLAFIKAKNNRTPINKKVKKDYFREATEYGVTTNKECWKKLEPFLTGYFSEDQISIEVNDKLVSDEKILTEILKEHYINIVEESSGSKSSSLENSVNPLLDETPVGEIIDTYRDHPSFIVNKSSVTQNSKFNLPQFFKLWQGYRSWRYSSEIY